VVSPRVPARDEARAIDVVGAIVVISPYLGFESTRREREPTLRGDEWGCRLDKVL
jgi:hypothetical protein